jgi:hypothetical protein
MQPSDANRQPDCHLERMVGNGEIEWLELCQTCDDPFFRSPGSVSCSARVPAVPRGWPPALTAPGVGATHSPSGIAAGRRRSLWVNRYGGLFRQETRHWPARHSAGLVRTTTRRLHRPRAASRRWIITHFRCGKILAPGRRAWDCRASEMRNNPKAIHLVRETIDAKRAHQRAPSQMVM